MPLKKYSIPVIVILCILTTYLHYSTAGEDHPLHDIYREIYYLPILIGALTFGLKGAIATYLLIVALYMPYVSISWTGVFATELNKLLHLVVQGFFAFFTGFLIDQNKRRAQQLEKDKYLARTGQVATTIVHDLKNPLITILGFARRLRQGKGDPVESAGVIMESAQKMQKIVNDVLDFSKPLKLNMEKHDVRKVISSASASCEAKAANEGIGISVKLPDISLQASVDSFQLERALINIINNAVEASQKGQHVIIESVMGKNKIIILVKDSGSGIDKETLENIFIPFYTKKASGTGLGMPITKKIIEAHGGVIALSSKPGGGTETTIEIPVTA